MYLVFSIIATAPSNSSNSGNGKKVTFKLIAITIPYTIYAISIIDTAKDIRNAPQAIICLTFLFFSLFHIPTCKIYQVMYNISKGST